jgi:hypothetical protein
VNDVESYPSTAAYWLSEIRQVTKSRPRFSDLPATGI